MIGGSARLGWLPDGAWVGQRGPTSRLWVSRQHSLLNRCDWDEPPEIGHSAPDCLRVGGLTVPIEAKVAVGGWAKG